MSRDLDKVSFCVGCRDVVAIEASFEEWNGKYCFGYFAFVIGSKLFGDQQELMDHASSARWAQTFLEARRDDRCFDVSKYSTADLIWHICGKHVSPPFPVGHKPQKRLLRCCEDWTYGQLIHHFGLSDVGEAAVRDSAAIAAVPQCDGTERVVAYEHGTGLLRDVYIKSSELEALLRCYVEWVETLKKYAPS